MEKVITTHDMLHVLFCLDPSGVRYIVHLHCYVVNYVQVHTVPEVFL